MTFDEAISIVLDHEGGYVNDPNDPGGETRFGISKRRYPLIDIKNLSIYDAKEIYRKDYWNKVKCDRLRPSLRLIVFDCAVNQGVVRAIKFLQKVLKVTVDGKIGPITLKAAQVNESKELILNYAHRRHDHYTSLKNWSRYSKGWSKRLLDVSILSVLAIKGVAESSVNQPIPKARH